MNRNVNRILVVLAVVAVCFSAYAAYAGREAVGIVKNISKGVEAVQLIAKWRDAQNIERSVITTQNPGESQDAFRDRHEAEVAKQVALHPPV